MEYLNIQTINSAVKIFLCRLQGVLKVLLPRLYSRSKKTVLYLETRINRKLKRGATEIVQIVIRYVQCTIRIPYTMIRKQNSVYHGTWT